LAETLNARFQPLQFGADIAGGAQWGLWFVRLNLNAHI
jgi:hypothetical protein